MPETALLIQMALLLMGIGAFAGVLAGLLGVGGGIVLVPAFYFSLAALGYDSPELMQICLATSLATIIVTSARSVAAHNRKGAVEWSILRDWAPGIAVGALLGVLVVASLRSQILVLTFSVLVFLIACYMVFGKSTWRLADQMPKGLFQRALSALVGFLSVLMGIGGGSFGVPIMTLHGVPIHRAVATAAGFGAIIAIPSVLGFFFVEITPEARPPYTLGAVNIPAFLLVIAMTTLTAPLGAALAHKLDQKKLKRVFAVFLMIVSINMLRKALMG